MIYLMPNNVQILLKKANKVFPATGLCSLFARAKMLYKRLANDVVEIFVILHISFCCCRLFNHCERQIARVFMVTTVSI